MSLRLFLLAALAVSCSAFVVTPQTGGIVRSAAASPIDAEMLFGAKKTAPKKAKKAVKKVVKKVVAKKVAKKAGIKGPSAAQPGTAPTDLIKGFFSEENWVYQAVTLLRGLPGK